MWVSLKDILLWCELMSATFLIKWLLVINFIFQAVLGCSPLILNCIRGPTCSKIKTFEDPNVFLLNDCSGYSHRERHSPDRKQKKTSFTYREIWVNKIRQFSLSTHYNAWCIITDYQEVFDSCSQALLGFPLGHFSERLAWEFSSSCSLAFQWWPRLIMLSLPGCI